jgi:hypothetical protein
VEGDDDQVGADGWMEWIDAVVGVVQLLGSFSPNNFDSYSWHFSAAHGNSLLDANCFILSNRNVPPYILADCLANIVLLPDEHAICYCALALQDAVATGIRRAGGLAVFAC